VLGCERAAIAGLLFALRGILGLSRMSGQEA
jgi:hypothetical protein